MKNAALYWSRHYAEQFVKELRTKGGITKAAKRYRKQANYWLEIAEAV